MACKMLKIGKSILTKRRWPTVAAIGSLFVLLLTSSGCSKKSAAGGTGGFPPTQVVAVTAKHLPVSETLSLVGTVQANEMVEIKPEVEGIVQDIHFKEGELVKKGQSLVTLDESKLAASVAEAEANFKLSEATFERSKQLRNDNLISQQDFDQASSTFEFNKATLDLKRRQSKDARVLAPFGGTVGARNISPGQVVSRTTTLTWLVDLDPVKVEINVPERFIAQLNLDQKIEISVAAFQNRKFTGKVYFIAPQLDVSTRTALVKAYVSNSDLALKPGMFASLDLTLRVKDKAVVIPESALMFDGDRVTVFLVGKDELAMARSVQVGVRLPGQAEISNGLQGGEMVIVEGLQKVRPGSKVKLAPPEAAVPYQFEPAKTNEVSVKG